MKRSPRGTGLADALFTNTQQRVLGLLFGQPDRSFFATELIALAESGSGAVQRELTRLEQSGLVTTRRIGTQKHYQANPESPIFAELTGIARKTVGLAEPLREALTPFAAKISAAFVYGSIAKRSDTASSDIDLMIISEALAYSDVFMALASATHRLGRNVNPTLHTRAEWAKGLAAKNAFFVRVMAQPKVWVVGNKHDLAA
jgi:DNA-binding MarR family transcriptional regulator